MLKLNIRVSTAVLMFATLYASAQNRTDTVTRQKNIDEVVVTGYKSQNRKTLTTSISKLDTKILQNAPRSNVGTALAGAVAGVRVNITSGQPGTTPQIVVRGGTDWNGSASPLILIDGVPGTLFGLNSSDVESIDVLKDAAATAIYGSQGGNGVIIVTTKKGKNGKANINLSTKTSFNFMSKTMPYMNAAEFVKFNRMGVKAYQDQTNQPSAFVAYLNGVNPAATGNNTTNSVYTTMVLTDANKYLLNFPGWQSIDDPITPGQKLIFMDNNMSQLYYQPSMSQEYNVSMDGGTDKANYYAGLGYLDDVGIVYGSKLKRYTGTVNASFKVRENFKVSSTMLYAISNSIPHYLGSDNYSIFQRAAGLAPTTRIFYNNPDGSLSGDYNPGVGLNFGNPLYYNDKFVRDNMEQRLTTSLTMDWGFAKDFNLTVRGSFFTVSNNNTSFAKKYRDGGNTIDTRTSSFSMNRSMRPQLTSFISYKKNYGTKHHVDALIGHEYYYNQYFSNYSATKGSPTDLIYTMGEGTAADGVPTSFKTKEATNSFFLQANYDYEGKYLLGINARTDGSSRLYKNNRYDIFPGISVGWNIHRENFFSSLIPFISTFKIRESYGVNGNVNSLYDEQTRNNFLAFGLYGGTGIYNSQGGYVYSEIPNPDLRWERVKSWNNGLDLGFFNNRLTIVADYYIRDIDRKLSRLVIPTWEGLSGVNQNIGTLRNKGFELEINGQIVRKPQFQWNIGGNFTTNKNYVKALPYNGLAGNRIGGTQIYDPATNSLVYVGGRIEGERVGLDVITAYVYEGVYKTQADLDAAKNLSVSFARQPLVHNLGDAKWKDLNGDNVIDYKDRAVIGRISPKLQGGLFTDLTYKGFNFALRTDFAIGHMMVNGARVKGLAQTQGAQNGPKEVTQTWTPENPDSNLPRYVFTDPQKNFIAAGSDQGDMVNGSSMMWEKGDYLALREITLGYSLNGSYLNNAVKNIRIYITGSNLHYFTKYSGTNPEFKGISFAGQDTGSFPLPKTYTLGMNMTF